MSDVTPTLRPVAVSPPPDPGRAKVITRFRLRRTKSAWRLALPFVLLVLVWSLVRIVFQLDDSVLPSPLGVAGGMGDLVFLGILPDDIVVTLQRFLVGALLAIAIGVPIGVLLGSSRVAERMFEPFVQFIQSIPDVALLPLLVMWFGFGNTTIQVAILYTALVPIVLNTMVGIQTTPDLYKQAVMTLGGGRARVLRDVYVPGALASIVVGVRLGLGYAWRILIVGEMIVGAGGLGFLIFDARRYFLISQVMVGMIVIGILYVIIDRLILVAIEDATVRRWGLQRL